MVFVTKGLGAGLRTKAGDGLHARDRPPGATPGNQNENHVDEWIAHTRQMMIETWEQEIVPVLLMGRAITYTVHASPQQPARFDCSQHFRDPAWPAAPGTQRKQ